MENEILDLYAVSGNAGWKVKPIHLDQSGWVWADFIFGFRSNGVAVLLKNRCSGKILDFVSVTSMLNYIQNFYNYGCVGVDVHNMFFETLKCDRIDRHGVVSKYRNQMNSNIVYKEIDLGEIK